MAVFCLRRPEGRNQRSTLPAANAKRLRPGNGGREGAAIQAGRPEDMQLVGVIRDARRHLLVMISKSKKLLLRQLLKEPRGATPKVAEHYVLREGRRSRGRRRDRKGPRARRVKDVERAVSSLNCRRPSAHLRHCLKYRGVSLRAPIVVVAPLETGNRKGSPFRRGAKKTPRSPEANSAPRDGRCGSATACEGGKVPPLPATEVLIYLHSWKSHTSSAPPHITLSTSSLPHDLHMVRLEPCHLCNEAKELGRSHIFQPPAHHHLEPVPIGLLQDGNPRTRLRHPPQRRQS